MRTSGMHIRAMQVDNGYIENDKENKVPVFT